MGRNGAEGQGFAATLLPVTGWTVLTTRGTAASFHDRALADPVVPTVWIHEITGPALILGSTQSDDLIERRRAEAEGVEVCRRHSGGGVVGLVERRHVWLDVVLPPWSPLWDDDIGRAFLWLGRTWARTLSRLVDDPAIEVHRGSPIRAEAGRVLCFAGLGAGEVTVSGQKVVGLSQRRTRAGARFQCALLPHWQPEFHARYLRAEPLAAAGIDLSSLPIGLPKPELKLTPAAAVETFLAELPDPGVLE